MVKVQSSLRGSAPTSRAEKAGVTMHFCAIWLTGERGPLRRELEALAGQQADVTAEGQSLSHVTHTLHHLLLVAGLSAPPDPGVSTVRADSILSSHGIGPGTRGGACMYTPSGI